MSASDDGRDASLPPTHTLTLEESAAAPASPWKIMIVDNDPTIHEATILALKDVTFEGRPLQFLSSFTAAQARAAMADHPDTGVILLEVALETDRAGLDFAQYVRQVVCNDRVRIILRTGHPERVPERQVIVNFDINDYKEKSELTSAKLFTLIHSALRAYRDIVAINATTQGLEWIIESSKDIFQISEPEQFAWHVLTQIGELIAGAEGARRQNASGNSLFTRRGPDGWQYLAGTGCYRDVTDVGGVLEHSYAPLVQQARHTNGIALGDQALMACFTDHAGAMNLLLLDGLGQLADTTLSLLHLYTRNVSIALDNMALHNDLEQAQQELIVLLGEAVENRSEETGGHVRRVAEISHFLTLKYGFTAHDAELLRAASPLHDLGKIAIPDVILHKPGALTDEERAIMRTHSEIGYKLLRPSRRQTLKLAATIAHEHHEHWDGGGYPQGKKGEDINIFARITAVADVFEALLAPRSYKKQWTIEQAVDFFRAQAGKQFDPAIVRLLLDNLEEVRTILSEIPDAVSDRATPPGNRPFMLNA